jgi:nitronate monooxygenase
MNWNNPFTKLLEIKYPFVQAPMLGVTTPGMVAAISNNDGLGSLPVGGLSAEKTIELIRKTKALTNKPFAVNLFANEYETPNSDEVTAMEKFLQDFSKVNGLPYQKESVENYSFHSYRELIGILLNEDVDAVSFTFGILDDESITALKEKKITLIGTSTSVEEALLLDEKGIDIIVAQGIEAGGHRGTFLTSEPLPKIGVMDLVPQVVKQVLKPVLAAGGISDGRTIKAAFMSGAQGVQIGTAFITSDESAAVSSYKSAILNASETDTVLTKSITGRWARGIKNKLITEIENAGIAIPAYPVQMHLTTPLRSYAMHHDNPDFISLWAGQSSGQAVMKPAAVIFNDLVKQAEDLS